MENRLPKNIILIGMPGAGKSTVGVVLAKTLGMKFVDTDLIIQDREKDVLQRIINHKGMDIFLDKEAEAVMTVTGEQMIIATGGSVVYRENAMKHLETLGTVIYLKVSYEEINRRINNIKTRGIAISEGKSLRGMYDERKALYEAYSDVIIECDGKSIEDVIDEIVGD